MEPIEARAILNFYLLSFGNTSSYYIYLYIVQYNMNMIPVKCF